MGGQPGGRRVRRAGARRARPMQPIPPHPTLPPTPPPHHTLSSVAYSSFIGSGGSTPPSRICCGVTCGGRGGAGRRAARRQGGPARARGSRRRGAGMRRALSPQPRAQPQLPLQHPCMRCTGAPCCRRRSGSWLRQWRSSGLARERERQQEGRRVTARGGRGGASRAQLPRAPTYGAAPLPAIATTRDTALASAPVRETSRMAPLVML